MTRKQRHQREERLLLPPSRPRNPFATMPKMRRGVAVHEKSRGALRREQHMRLQHALRGDLSAMEE